MLGLLQIFYGPDKVFERVRETGTWLVAFLAVMLVTTTTGALAVNLIGMETITRKQLESNPRIVEQLGPEKVDQAVRSSNTPVRKAMVFVAGGFGAAIYMLVVAGIFTGLLAMMDARVKYKQILGACSYAFFPFAVVTCLMSALIIVLSNDRSELDIRNLIALNPGAFLNKETTAKAVYSLSSSLDLISFGQIAMLSYGLSKVSGVAIAKCLAMVVVMWAIYVLAKTGMAAAF